MEKYKEKAIYESPQTKVCLVSLESGICAASGNFKNPNSENGRIEEHKVNSNFSFDFNDQDWEIIDNNNE